MSKREDLTGRRFGRLIVLNFARRSPNGHAIWLCQCSCPRQTLLEVFATNLKRLKTQGCVCILEEYHAAQAVAAKMNSPLYITWINMRVRCSKEDGRDYKDWGGRGITVCDEWLDLEKGFALFEEWATKNGWREGLTLDRVDNDGNYTSENCQWATRKQQARNRRSNRMVNPFGEGEMPLIEAVEKYSPKSLNYHQVKKRLNRGWDLKDALTRASETNPGQYKKKGLPEASSEGDV